MSSALHERIIQEWVKKVERADRHWETEGILELPLDTVVAIQVELVKPTLEGYDKFLDALENDDDEVIEEFEEKVWDAYCAAEKEAIKVMIERLRGNG